METYIVKEIRSYEESIFMGLSKRQFFCSLLAIATAVTVYFGLRNLVGVEIVGWLCMLAALPFALMGFVRYHGMTAEKFFVAFIRSEILMPKHLKSKPVNLYAEALRFNSMYREVLKVD